MPDPTVIYESKENVVVSEWPHGAVEIEDGSGDSVILRRDEIRTVIAELEAYWARGDKPEGGA